MAVPTSNINFSDIWSEANQASPTTMLSLNTMSFFSYFTGPNGSNNQPDNNWGQGEGSGANRIYLTTAKTTNIKVGDFSGLDYFYDQNRGRFVEVKGVYGGPSPTMPPDPPDAYDFNIRLDIYDDSFSYIYMQAAGLMGPGFGIGPLTISVDNVTPMINTYYWVLDVFTTPSYPGSSGAVSVNLNINNTAYITGGTINNGSNQFTSTTYGTASISLNQPAVNKTGSYWAIDII